MRASPLIITATVAGTGTLGWVAFRLYVRSRVVEELNTTYGYDAKIASLGPLRESLRLPSAKELSESITPIWSTVMPETAIADLMKNGRRSPYWPKDYKTGALSAKLEPYILAFLQKASVSGSAEQLILENIQTALKKIGS